MDLANKLYMSKRSNYTEITLYIQMITQTKYSNNIKTNFSSKQNKSIQHNRTNLLITIQIKIKMKVYVLI